MRTVVMFLIAAGCACSDAPGFDPALWKFTPVVPLRRAPVGGWQEACAYLKFIDDREIFPEPKPPWKCGIMVGMPLATAMNGPISAELAAQLTATIATKASAATFHSQPVWIGEDYCIVLRRKMNELFPIHLGAKVNQC